MFTKFKYHLLLHLIIFIWGFTGILGRLIELDAYLIVWFRVLIAFVSLGVVLLLLKRLFKPPPIKRLIQVGIVGFVVGLHWLTFYLSIQMSTVSLGILCLSTTTIHVAWIEPLVMKRSFSFIELLLSGVVVYGIYFVSDNFTTEEYIALAIGLTSALFAATFAVFNMKLSEDVPPEQITFYEMIAAFLLLSGFLIFQERLDASVFEMTLSDFLWLLFLGAICTSFAFLVTIQIMQRLGAFTVSLSINLEPVYTIILAIIIFKEHEALSPNFYVGSAIIVLVVIANGIIKAKQKKKISAEISHK